MTRTHWLSAATVLLFVVTVALLLYAIPGPRQSTDYLVIGAVATFVCLLLLFVILIRSAKQK